MSRMSVLTFLALLSTAAGAVTVSVNGQPLEAESRLVGGRVFVPMRAVFQALGADVTYQKGQILASGLNLVELELGASEAKVDGRSVELDAPPRLMAGKTYVPLRFVAQSLGAEVEWNASRQSVAVQKGGKSTAFQADRELRRLAIGNQAGILKVWDARKASVAYFRGIDDRSVALLSQRDQEAILEALGVGDLAERAAVQVMTDYQSLPKKEALAFLGVINSLPADRLSGQAANQVRRFLVSKMLHDSQVVNRRQAVLALALGSEVDQATADAVIDFYRSRENLWETFPVQQFFEYQAENLKSLTGFSAVKRRALAVNSLYRENIASYLD